MPAAASLQAFATVFLSRFEMRNNQAPQCAREIEIDTTELASYGFCCHANARAAIFTTSCCFSYNRFRVVV